MKRERIEGAPWFKNLVTRIGIYRGDPTSRELEMLADITLERRDLSVVDRNELAQ